MVYDGRMGVRAVSLALLCAGCSYHSPATPGDDAPPIDAPGDATDAGDAGDGPVEPWLHPWTHRKTVTLHASQVAATLTDFPVLVSVDDAEIAASAQTDGKDVVFTTADKTTLLASEIESLAGNQLVAWVKIPTLSDTADTVLYVYYGHPANFLGGTPTAVWSAGYEGVWHLQQNPGVSAIGDSTAHARNGTPDAGMTAANQTTGAIGRGLAFNGSSDFLDFSSFDVGNTFTISMWIELPDVNSVKTLFANSPQGSSTNGFRFFVNTNGNSDRRLVFETGNGSNSAATQTGQDTIPTKFTHVAAVVDRATPKTVLYIDGAVAATSGTTRDDFNTSSDFEVARMEGSLYWPGKLDEVELSSVLRPAEWFETAFNNQSDLAAFETLGGEENEP